MLLEEAIWVFQTNCVICLFTSFILMSFTMLVPTTAQKMEFSIKDFFSKCDQIRTMNAFLPFRNVS